MTPRLPVAGIALLLLGSALGATEPSAATRRWWSHIVALAGDDMRGRDTGSAELRRAQEYVARHLERNGLRPAGEEGFFQKVNLRALRLRADRSSATVVANGRTRELRWLRDISIAPVAGLPESIQGRLVFAGSDNAASLDTNGAIVVRLSAPRLVPGPPTPPPPAGSIAIVAIDSARGPEPSRWPLPYSVSMTLAEPPRATPSAPPVAGPAPPRVPTLRFNPAAAEILFEGSGRTYREILDSFEAGRTFPSFALSGSLGVRPVVESAELSCDNVIGVLKGSDPELAREHVVLGAHIDGYGVGEPWGDDAIYNGAFDDAAYVATLLDFVEAIRERGVKLRRSLLVASFTGEEKGLLGSRHFTRNPTVPRESLVANVNLDQLRPIFPLHTLTMHSLDETSLGEVARRVAAPLGIRIQADPEPLRNLVRRSDNFPFLQIGVPASGFVFGYAPGTSDETAYRRWYEDRYHTPKDDLSQPWVPEAAERFNLFFERLVVEIANADARPVWTRPNPYAPRP